MIKMLKITYLKYLLKRNEIHKRDGKASYYIWKVIVFFSRNMNSFRVIAQHKINFLI